MMGSPAHSSFVWLAGSDDDIAVYALALVIAVRVFVRLREVVMMEVVRMGSATVVGNEEANVSPTSVESNPRPDSVSQGTYTLLDRPRATRALVALSARQSQSLSELHRPVSLRMMVYDPDRRH